MGPALGESLPCTTITLAKGKTEIICSWDQADGVGLSAPPGVLRVIDLTTDIAAPASDDTPAIELSYQARRVQAAPAPPSRAAA